MTADGDGTRRAPGVQAGRILRLPLELLAAAAELPLSRRGLPLLFLAVAGGLSLAGWLRPPLSPDVGGLSLCWRSGDQAAPDEFLHGSRPQSPVSVGACLLAVLAIGAPLVLWQPAKFGTVAGVLLATALAATGAAVCNHPALVERMDHEYEQRQHIVSVTSRWPAQKRLVDVRNGRIGVRLGAPAADEQRGDPRRGWVYLYAGRWLILWAAFGLVAGTPGLLGIRLSRLLTWSVVGMGLAGLACWPRLHAEYHWAQARRLEAEGDTQASQRALSRALGIFPGLAQLERTWLLAGKLDHRAGLVSSPERFFRAYQLCRDQEEPRGTAYALDLPWMILDVPDYRRGLDSPLTSFDQGEAAHAPGTPISRRALAIGQGPAFHVYHYGKDKALERALDLMLGLWQKGHPEPALRHQTARILTELGLRSYLREPVFTDAGPDYSEQARRLGAARRDWQRALAADPSQRDCLFCLGNERARGDPAHPEQAESALVPLMAGLADRLLRADILTLLGHVSFGAGQMARAQRFFAQSCDVFNLPHRVNCAAQRALGGL